jgi:hypothetical protein
MRDSNGAQARIAAPCLENGCATALRRPLQGPGITFPLAGNRAVPVAGYLRLDTRNTLMKLPFTAAQKWQKNAHRQKFAYIPQCTAQDFADQEMPFSGPIGPIEPFSVDSTVWPPVCFYPGKT